jgi:acyl carrier protein
LFQVDWVALPAPAGPVPALPAVLDLAAFAALLAGAGTPALLAGGGIPELLAEPLCGAGAPGPRAGGGDDAPGLVVLAPGTAGEAGGVVAATHRLVEEVTAAVQGWLAAERFAGSRLVVLTCGAVAAGPGEEVADLAGAALWGLLRCAQAEHPGRFVLLDAAGAGLDGLGGDPGGGLASAVGAALACGEPQLAVRAGRLLAPRLARAPAAARQAAAWAHPPEGTVLVTGGAGTLGGLLAEHLVATGRGRHLLLAGRRGPAGPGVAALAARLHRLGAAVTVSACDVADPEAVAALLAGIPAGRPLAAVFHAAGVVEDATLANLTPARVHAVLRPKVDAAWQLHRATAHLGLAAFVLYSSVAGVLGSPGQGNYAAANAFLDALAAHRHAAGLPATSLAWGYWAQASGMTGRLGHTDRVRIARAGLAPLPTGQALGLLDAALDAAAGGARPALVAAAFDPAVLRAQAQAAGAAVPVLLRGLVPTAPAGGAAGPVGAADRLADRLAGLDHAGQARLLAELVRAQVAAVLGHADPAGIDPRRPFKDLGFDSLTAVELRNRLATATGLRLPATLVFDQPKVRELAAYLHSELAPQAARESDRALAQLEALERTVLAIAPDDAGQETVIARLNALLERVDGHRASQSADQDLHAATIEQIFDIFAGELDHHADGNS